MVTVEFKINADGSVVDAKVLSGPYLLRAASVQAAKQWRFKVSDENEAPFQATFDFRLEGSCKTTESCKEKLLIRYPDRIIITSEIPGIQPGPAGLSSRR